MSVKDILRKCDPEVKDELLGLIAAYFDVQCRINELWKTYSHALRKDPFGYEIQVYQQLEEKRQMLHADILTAFGVLGIKFSDRYDSVDIMEEIWKD